MQVKKQQLELDMEQPNGAKLGKEFIKAVYCYPAYLSYMWCTEAFAPPPEAARRSLGLETELRAQLTAAPWASPPSCP